MQVANEQSVLGDFSGQSFSYFDTKTELLGKDGKFFALTQNAAGEDVEFEITHTFGVTPLQQYLVDAGDGKKQALQIAWDSRAEDSGGQRWYHLYADEYVGPNDPLHWTGRFFNWNTMCAECHSTNLDVGYDVASNSYATTYDEISVGCEACHGPGSQHVDQADRRAFDVQLGLSLNFDDRVNAAWIMNTSTGIAERSAQNDSHKEPESCGRCHARRAAISPAYEYGAPLLDTHIPSLLDENLYFADGRIQDEVYVYGSFLQSKMYAAGVTCSDCHDPHSGNLLAGPDPNDSCAQCHLPAIFATIDHGDDAAGNCVDCHMQQTTYMGIDGRRDHSFRLPNTDSDSTHYGEIIAAGRSGDANLDLLRGIANESFPPIARATMLTLLEPRQTENVDPLILQQLDSADAIVRVAALRAIRNLPAISGGSYLLRDPILAVRIEAVLTFLDYRELLPVADARAFSAAADEYRAALLANAFSPDTAARLGEFESRLGNSEQARKFYEHAIRIDPEFSLGHHLYGLSLVRDARPQDALSYLKRATELAPDDARYVYVYSVALHSLGESDAAVEALRDAARRFPGNFDIGWALATIYRDRGDRSNALNIAKRLQQEYPQDSRVHRLIVTLSQ